MWDTTHGAPSINSVCVQLTNRRHIRAAAKKDLYLTDFITYQIIITNQSSLVWRVLPSVSLWDAARAETGEDNKQDHLISHHMLIIRVQEPDQSWCRTDCVSRRWSRHFCSFVIILINTSSIVLGVCVCVCEPVFTFPSFKTRLSHV